MCARVLKELYDIILSPVCHVLIHLVYVEKGFLHFKLVELVFN